MTHDEKLQWMAVWAMRHGVGRGEAAESQLYDWLKWFDDNGFIIETGALEMDQNLGIIGVLFNQHRYVRMVRK